MKPIIIIPAYNPPLIFESLVSKIKKLYSFPLIIIDDGSYPIVSFNKSDVIILTNNINYGKGYSLRKAFNFAYTKGYTHAFTLDADFQHDPKYINCMYKVNPNVDIVIGARTFNSQMPIHRRLSNKITSNIVSFLSNTKIYDSQSGFRRYKLSTVNKNKYIEDGFQFETEVLIKTLNNSKANLKHIPISTIYKDEPSYINNILDTIKFIKLVIRHIFPF